MAGGRNDGRRTGGADHVVAVVVVLVVVVVVPVVLVVIVLVVVVLVVVVVVVPVVLVVVVDVVLGSVVARLALVSDLLEDEPPVVEHPGVVVLGVSGLDGVAAHPHPVAGVVVDGVVVAPARVALSSRVQKNKVLCF